MCIQSSNIRQKHAKWGAGGIILIVNSCVITMGTKTNDASQQRKTEMPTKTGGVDYVRIHP